MTIKNEKQESKLKMSFDCGVDDEGKAVVRSKTYSRVKAESNDEAIYSVAKTIGDLQSNRVQEVSRVDESVLIEE